MLYGVSYGTKVALDYAAKYPANVEALVLDSVVPPEGPTSSNARPSTTMPRALRELCGERRVHAASRTSVGHDLADLVAQGRARQADERAASSTPRRHAA